MKTFIMCSLNYAFNDNFQYILYNYSYTNLHESNSVSAKAEFTIWARIGFNE